VSTNSITETEKITRWLNPIERTTDMSAQPDNVYPFSGSQEDQWAIVMNGLQIAWAAEYGTACMIYVTALQTQREHAERCPADTIPFDGIAPTSPQGGLAKPDDELAGDYGLDGVTL
jgi:hypothetical protein